MKRAYLIGYFLSLGLCLAAILFRDQLEILDKVLVLLGVGLFLLTFVLQSRSRAMRCPNCGAPIMTSHIYIIAHQKDGLFPCPQCGTLVEVRQRLKK